MTERRANEQDEQREDDQQAAKQPSDYNDPVDEAGDESFPASDPPSSSGATVSREPDDARDG